MLTTNSTRLCACGCGGTITRDRWRNPPHYLYGHHRRKSPVDYVVEDRGYITPCHIWQLTLDGKGYGRKVVPGAKGKEIPAHQWFYEKKHGPVPDGLVLDHLCRERSCCNADHVEPVTTAENNRRGNRWRQHYTNPG